MGWRFRKSIKVFPGVRLNFGKKGFTSATFGRGWFSSNISKRGVKHTFSVPGTGISYQTETVGPSSQTQPNVLYKPTETCWTCSKCLMINLPESTNCEICASENPRIRTNSMIAAGEIYWYCKQCYKANLPESRFCEKCGGNYSPNPQQTVKSLLTKKQWFVIGGSIVSLFSRGSYRVYPTAEKPKSASTVNYADTDRNFGE